MANYYVHNHNIDVNEEDQDLLGEYPDDEYQDDEDEELVDSDGEPLPSPEQIRDIINAIPSYRYEEKSNQFDAKDKDKKSEGESFTERKKAEIKQKENEVICSICIDRIKTGA